MSEDRAARAARSSGLHLAMLTRSVAAHHPAGGMELHTQMLRCGFVRRGHQVTTITTSHPHGTPISSDDCGATHFVGGGPPGSYSPTWARQSVEALLRLHQTHPVDAIISQSGGGYGYLSARERLPSSARIPVVVITHGSVATEIAVRLAQLARQPLATIRWGLGAGKAFALDARYLPRADAVTTLSPLIRRHLCRWFRLEPQRVDVIPNGIDVSACLAAASHRSHMRARLHCDDDTCLIVGIGELVARKGFRYLLDAFARLCDTHPRRNPRLIIAGDGSDYGRLRTHAARLDLSERALFIGRVPHEQISSLLWAADIVAMPSLEEGVPLTLLEAMACARPIVAAHVGGIPNILHDGPSGLLIPPRDAQALAQTLGRLVDDHALARRLGAHAQTQAIAEFDAALMVDRYASLVHQTVATARNLAMRDASVMSRERSQEGM